MAHQAHALPWTTLSNLLTRAPFKPKSNRSLPQQIDLYPVIVDDTIASKQIRNFSQALQTQIQSFAQTERRKFDEAKVYKDRALSWSRGGADQSIIPDVLINQYEDLQREDLARMQRVQTWIDHYDISHWDEGGEVIKLLITTASAADAYPEQDDRGQEHVKTAIESLLFLANNRRVNLANLINMAWGHHFGVSRVAEEALKSYIYFNIIYSKACENQDIMKEYREYPSYQRLLESVTGHYDGDAQNHFHRSVLLPNSDHHLTKDILVDLGKMKVYLKVCWRISVNYQVVLQELGKDADWDGLVRSTMAHLYGIYGI